MPKNQTTKAIADPDTRDSGMLGSSSAPSEGGGRKASLEELTNALAAMHQQNLEIKAQIATMQTQQSDPISRLADLLTPLVQKQSVQAVPETDNLNRTTDFRNQRATMDGQAMMESQQILAGFKNEEKLPISIPKTINQSVGSSLAITVNGVRVSIPCDGKTYYINRTHWEHARERLAKLDIQNSKNEPQIVEIS